MQSSLVISDTKKFLDKYTRFMTKDVYISSDMNREFLNSYAYLKDELEKNKYLYQDRNDYKNLFRIYQNGDKMLKLHNQKYLKRAIVDLDSFFEKMNFNDVLNKYQQMAVLSLENKMMVISKKNDIPLIISKIKYMSEYSHIDLKKVEILVCDMDDMDMLKSELKVYDLLDVSVSSIDEYKQSCLRDGESFVQQSDLYWIFFDYITLSIYPDKKRFDAFYKSFCNDIYLNRDYKDFDTFRDYHCYLYKRMFLESHLSLRKYNEREIKKRRGQLRLIDNKIVFSREEVDVGNFLYLNSIDYEYDKDKRGFLISSNSYRNMISFLDVESSDEYETISLDKKDKYLEVLVYELLKRQYGMEKRSDDEVYQMLRDTTASSYFSEFIREILIPSIYYYRENSNLDGTNFSKDQRDVLDDFYHYYLEYLKKNSCVDDLMIKMRVQERLDTSCYEYFVVLGECPFEFKKNYFIVMKDYPELSFIRENIRIMYDYKAYLDDRKCLSVPHAFCSREELSFLSGEFIKENLDYLNKKIEENKKSVCLSFYEEENRLKSSVHLCAKVSSIVECEKDNSIAFFLKNKNDVKSMLSGHYFEKKGQELLQNEYGIFDCFSISSIQKKYDIIILPTLVRDSYHQSYFDKDEVYGVKIGLFKILSKCRQRVYLLIPNSKKDIYLKVFDRFDYIEYDF